MSPKERAAHARRERIALTIYHGMMCGNIVRHPGGGPVADPATQAAWAINRANALIAALDAKVSP